MRKNSSIGQSIMAVIGTLGWTLPVLALFWYIPILWEFVGYRIEKNPKLFVFIAGFLFYLVLLGVIWAKVWSKASLPGNAKLCKGCSLFVLVIAAGMIAVQLACYPYAAIIHDRSDLRQLEFSEVESAVCPGETYTFVTEIREPLSSQVKMAGNQATLELTANAAQTPQSLFENLPASIVMFGSDPPSARNDLTYETTARVHTGWLRSTVYSVIKPVLLKVKMTLPESASQEGFQVKGQLHFLHTSSVSKEFSFWVFPPSLKPEILREQAILQRQRALIPAIILACTAIMPLFFLFGSKQTF